MREGDYIVATIGPDGLPHINQQTQWATNQQESVAMARSIADRTDGQVVVLRCCWQSEGRFSANRLDKAREAGL